MACLAAFCMAVCACNRGGFQWDGKWTGSRNYKSEPGQDPSVAYTLAKVELKIADGRYDLFEGGIPRSGVYEVKGKQLRLTSTLVMEHKGPQQADGSLMEVDANTIDYMGVGANISPIRLKRETQPGK